MCRLLLRAKPLERFLIFGELRFDLLAMIEITCEATEDLCHRERWIIVVDRLGTGTLAPECGKRSDRHAMIANPPIAVVFHRHIVVFLGHRVPPLVKSIQYRMPSWSPHRPGRQSASVSFS
jgi:hypothetical protein